MSGKPTTPLLTVDIIIEVAGGIVLIERKNPPPGWALPGGFVDVGESVAQAAVREAREETSLEVAGGIVLIERKNPPPGWALPGGFVDVGESVAQAAVREAREETSLDVSLVEQFFAYSDPKRDPRGATVSVVFLARATGTPRAEDDAKNIGIYALDKLPPLAFDHGQILEDYRRYKKDGTRPPVNR